ncbi:diguanylate cyclase (GGDEF) domain-containing protein [Acetitomaculum ruminis DSM 5522]|uniref:Diguanylate cyclase (GGDEF) domain-containing protein n=1 Tax=Acetitomaculum ruminis DSM 5522 TaxID=1120918 RepID=A0A1I0YYK0_9FIRM|nr:GGDEF domain-containing protein [Acetitomaculum ruminis]SFB17123.1 diguanylate cyclase (GGDEF) domain-containing protein [Acetitomaculum ruminis DSM 5522]
MNYDNGRDIGKKSKGFSVFNARVRLIYMLFIIVTILLSLYGACFSGISFEALYVRERPEKIEAKSINLKGEYVEYELDADTIEQKGKSIGIYINNLKYEVYADNEKIAYLKKIESVLGNTYGRSWSIIDIPASSKEVYVNIYTKNKEVLDDKIDILAGDKLSIYQYIINTSLPNIIFGIFFIGMSIYLKLQWYFVIRKSGKADYMAYFATLDFLIGVWFLSVSNYVLLEENNRLLVYFVGHMCIMATAFPFLMFAKRFYRMESNNLLKGLIVLSVFVPIAALFLQVTSVMELRECLPFIHVVFVLSMIYISLAVIKGLYQKRLSKSMKMSLLGLFIFFITFTYTIFDYYLSDSFNFSLAIYGMLIYCLFTWFGIAIENVDILKDSHDIELYKQLAGKDVLTGLANRNYFEKYCKDVISISDKCVVILDLNNLKYINDTYGHAKGDYMIKTAASMIKYLFSNSGFCYRIGGDEFCVILNGISDFAIEEKIRQLRIMEDIFNKENKDIKIYLALGFAFYEPRIDKSISDIIKRADEAMYEDKEKSKAR